MYSSRIKPVLLLCCSVVGVIAHPSGSGMRVSRSEVNVHFHDVAQEFRRSVDTKLQKRQTCGAGIGSCPAGQCCSGAGFCGTTEDYCMGPQCQIGFSGSSCDATNPPPGGSTLSVARPRIGNVPYGSIITSCATPGTVALTFDDGPYSFTTAILDLLAQHSIKATFFICGNNIGKGRIDDASLPWPGILQRMHSAGHQLASHTWTHEDLTQVSATIRQQQVIYNEMAFSNLFGFFPTYLRPPYGACTAASGCLADLTDLGYHLINWNIDTKDYNNDSPSLIQNSKDTFSSSVSTRPTVDSYIELSHDTHQQTAINLTAFMISTLQARGYRAVPVGECLGDPPANWYRSAAGRGTGTGTGSTTTGVASTTLATVKTTSTSTSPSSTSTSLAVSSDGTCASRSTGKFTCLGSTYGNCCSAYGWCGSTSDYCGGGCNAAYGSCTTGGSGSTLKVSTNGVCGGTTGQTCQGSTYGNCCSKYGFCGGTTAYCGTGCQSGFGTCS